MAWIPVSADTYFRDFAFDVVEYTIFRNGNVIASADGLANSNRYGKYISFRYGTDVQIGDVLVNGSDRFLVRKTDVDLCNGNKELISAYY